MTEDQFEKLAQMIKGVHDDLSERMDSGFAQVQEQFAQVHEELTAIRMELREIRSRLDTLENKVDEHSGYAKEIDHILERVVAIERHLGIQSKVAA